MTKSTRSLHLVDFVNSTLLRLAEPASRASVFDETALEHMAHAAYDAAALSIRGPYKPVFDKMTLGWSVAPLSVGEGVIRNQAGVPTADVQLRVSGLGSLLPSSRASPAGRQCGAVAADRIRRTVRERRKR